VPGQELPRRHHLVGGDREPDPREPRRRGRGLSRRVVGHHRQRLARRAHRGQRSGGPGRRSGGVDQHAVGIEQEAVVAVDQLDELRCLGAHGASYHAVGGGWYIPRMRPYLDLLRLVLADGERRTDRTGVGTLSIFGAQSRYDLRDGFPIVTTKKVLFPAVVRELLWFLRGSTNIHDDLTQHTPIWDAWADGNGDLGPIYGHQWRRWGADPASGRPGIDQLADAIALIQRIPPRAASSSARGTSPTCRR
jgi:hypothetical protein